MCGSLEGGGVVDTNAQRGKKKKDSGIAKRRLTQDIGNKVCQLQIVSPPEKRIFCMLVPFGLFEFFGFFWFSVEAKKGKKEKQDTQASTISASPSSSSTAVSGPSRMKTVFGKCSCRRPCGSIHLCTSKTSS